MLGLTLSATALLAQAPLALSKDLGTDPKPFVALLIAGLVIGILGHLSGLRVLVVAGIVAIALATVLLPVGIYVTKSG